MGMLFRLLLTKLFGVRIHTAAHLSEVSKTIESLPGSRRNKWFWGGLLHFSPVALIVVLLFALRASQMRHSGREIAALFLAIAWVWLGPVLIWYYEKITLPRFVRNCRAIISVPQDYYSIRRAVRSNIYDLRFCRYFTLVWVLVVTVAFLNSTDLLSGFGVNAYRDPFWFFLLLGVILFSYYTSLGFCFCYKAYRLALMVSNARLDKRIYHVDGVFGLSFIGDFAFTTAAMFFSGWLFAPLIFFGANQKTLWQFLYSTPVLLLATLFIFTLLSFLVPIYIIHHKILGEKSIRSKVFYTAANKLSAMSENPISDDDYKKLDFARKLIAEIQAIPNWPLRVDTGLKFLLTSIFVPVLAGLFTAILKAKAGAP